MLDCIWRDCFAQVCPRLNKDLEGAAADPRGFAGVGFLSRSWRCLPGSGDTEGFQPRAPRVAARSEGWEPRGPL